MKKFLSKLLTIAILLPQFAGAGSIGSSTVAENLGSKTNRNYVLNPGAEKNLANITDSSTITTRSTSSPIEGVAQFAIDATTTGQNVDWALAAFQQGLKGQNCEADWTISGDASLYQAEVVQNSIVLQNSGNLSNFATPTVVQVFYPCGDLSTTTFLRLTSTGNGAAILVDSVYTGLASSISQSNVISPWVAFVPVGNWTNTTYTGFWRRVGDTAEIQFYWAPTGTPASSSTFNLTLPTGLVMDTTKMTVSTTIPYSTGSYFRAATGEARLIGNYTSTTTFDVNYLNSTGATSQTDVTAHLTKTTPYTVGTGDLGTMFITVPIVGFQAQNIFTTSQTLDLLGSTIYTGAPSCPQGTLAADGTAVSRTANAALFARIGTTFGVGDGTTTFNVPNGSAVVIRGTGTQTINARVKTGPSVGSTQEDQMQGHFHSATPGTTTDLVNSGSSAGYLRVNTATATTGSPTSDGTNGTPRTGTETQVSSLGMRPCVVNVYQQAPILIGSVTSATTGTERVERAYFGGASNPSNCTTGTCTLYSSTSGIASIVEVATGQYTVTFATNAFSGTPSCSGILKSIGAANTFMSIEESPTPSSTSFKFSSVRTSNVNADAFGMITCQGPH